MVPIEKRILIKAANMYYMDHMKQSEIARRMGVDRTTVSKYLKRALEYGIVTINVESDSYEELEAALAQGENGELSEEALAAVSGGRINWRAVVKVFRYITRPLII